MDKFSTQLKIAFASQYAFALKAQNFHWNVEGPDFFQYHGLFEKIYDEVYDSVDTIAERVRTLGAYTPGSFSRYSELSQIEDQVEIPDAQSMIQKLLADIQVIQTSVKMCYDLEIGRAHV